MRYRDKLKRDHPDLACGRCWGGCIGCPGDYYSGAPVVDGNCNPSNEGCTLCWDTEATDFGTNGCDLCDDYDKFGSIVCYLPLDNGEAKAVPLNHCPKCGRRVEE